MVIKSPSIRRMAQASCMKQARNAQQEISRKANCRWEDSKSKTDVREQGVTNSCCSEQRLAVGSREDGNEPSGSLKGGLIS